MGNGRLFRCRPGPQVISLVAEQPSTSPLASSLPTTTIIRTDGRPLTLLFASRLPNIVTSLDMLSLHVILEYLQTFVRFEDEDEVSMILPPHFEIEIEPLYASKVRCPRRPQLDTYQAFLVNPNPME